MLALFCSAAFAAVRSDAVSRSETHEILLQYQPAHSPFFVVVVVVVVFYVTMTLC